MPISIVWDAKIEARFQEWLKAPERPWNRILPQVMEEPTPITLEVLKRVGNFTEELVFISAAPEPVSKPPAARKMGRPSKVLSQDILDGPGSTREKARRMGVGHMTVWRRLRQGGGTWKKGT